MSAGTEASPAAAPPAAVQRRPLAVGLNLVFLGEQAAGAGRYARELAGALLGAEPGLRLTGFVARQAPADLLSEPWAGEVDWVRLPVRVGRPPIHLAAQLAAIPVIAARRRLDVIHSPANIGPVRARPATVVTLLDVIWLHEPRGWGSPGATRMMRGLSLHCARRADRVIAISEAAREDFVSMIGLDPAKIDVTPLGVRLSSAVEPVADAELRRRHGLGEGPLVLCVAQKRPYKNQAALVRAIAELPRTDARLVLAGAPGDHEAELRAQAAALGVSDRVHFPGWVSEAELEGLYRAAECFVLPSLIEGFGLPVLEAMARGVPVACSDRGALPEIGGDAALYFDPADQQSVTGAVARLLNDRPLAEELRRRGPERCKAFGWERTARATLASYRRALEGRGR